MAFLAFVAATDSGDQVRHALFRVAGLSPQPSRPGTRDSLPSESNVEAMALAMKQFLARTARKPIRNDKIVTPRSRP